MIQRPPYPAGPPTAGRSVPPAATQTLPLVPRSIADGIVTLPGCCCAVLQTGALNLASLHAADLAGLSGAYHAFLAGLDFPVQLLVRVQPADPAPYLQWHAAQTAARAAADAGLQWLVRGHQAHVARLVAATAPLAYRCYVIVPAPAAAPAVTTPATRLRDAVLRHLPWQRGEPLEPGPAASPPGDGVAEVLAARCGLVRSALEAAGVAVHRLDDAELTALWATCLRPGGAAGLPATPTPLPPGASREGTGEPAAGLLTALPDLLAPSWMEIARDHLCLEGRYARTFALVTYPRAVTLGWLHRLIAAGEYLDLSLHLLRLDTALAQAELTTRMTQLRSSQLHADRRGHLDDASTDTALGDCRRVRQALQEGHDALLSASLYLTLYGSSRAELDARAARVERLAAGLLAQVRPAVWQAQAGLQSTLPTATDELRVRRTLPASSVVTMFPFTTPSLEMPGGVLWGRDLATNALVLVNPWSQSQPNANVAVLATSGAGKSYAIKLDLLRTLPLGIHALVIDPDDEYAGLATALQGQVVRLGPGSPHRINPLALPRTPRGRAHLPLQAEDEAEDSGRTAGSRSGALDPLAAHMASLLPLLEVLLAGGETRLTQGEKASLETALACCYAAAGITANPATHGRRPPTVADLAAALAAGGDAAGLADRLGRYCTGPYASIFNGQSTVDLDNRLVVFSLAALPEETTEPEVRAAVMLLIAAHVLRTAQLDRRQRRRIVVDEAHLLARYPAGDRFLASLARRARKYGLGVTAISQQLEDFLTTTSGQAVLKNSSTRLLLLQTAETLGALEQHLQLTSSERACLLTRGRGEGLLLVGRQRVMVRLEASPEEHRLCHTDAAQHEAIVAPLAPGPCSPHPPAVGEQAPALPTMPADARADQPAEGAAAPTALWARQGERVPRATGRVLASEQALASPALPAGTGRDVPAVESDGASADPTSSGAAHQATAQVPAPGGGCAPPPGGTPPVAPGNGTTKTAPDGCSAGPRSVPPLEACAQGAYRADAAGRARGSVSLGVLAHTQQKLPGWPSQEIAQASEGAPWPQGGAMAAWPHHCHTRAMRGRAHCRASKTCPVPRTQRGSPPRAPDGMLPADEHNEGRESDGDITCGPRDA